MIVRRTLTRTEKDKRFVLGEPNLRYTCATPLLTGSSHKIV